MSRKQDTQDTTQQLKAKARGLGFHLAGVCPAATPTGYHRLLEWLELGYDGQMGYLSRRREAYEHPRHVLPGVRSLLMLGMSYFTEPRRHPVAGEGNVASYAWGEADYHDVIHQRLRSLCQTLEALCPEATARGVVDTAPLLEREFAQLAGLGWVGKNTLLLNKNHGSYFFLAAVLTDQELAYDEPFLGDHCGTCRACLDACPTDAFPQPYVLDATRCISYLTIELHEAVPMELRGQWDDWVFGCDVCQQVCPWNHQVQGIPESPYGPTPDKNPLELAGLFFLSEEAFRGRFRKTALWRAKRRGILRNAALVLGAQGAPESVPALTRGLEDGEPLVREACGWALEQIRDHRQSSEPFV